MTRSRIAVVLTACVVLASVHSLVADVRTDEKTKFQLAGAVGKIINIFGGKAARDGVTSTVALKGQRKITFNDTTGQIVDLTEEKVYDLDMKKKTYKVTTFADLRRQMEEAQKKAEESAKQQPATERPPAAQQDPNQKNIDVDFDIKNTGQAKTINGFNTHESIVTITVREKDKKIEDSGGLIMTVDMWLGPTMPAMKEIGEFDMKYAQKLYGSMMIAGASPQDMAAAAAMYPMMKPALARMSAEGGKVEGTAILTTTTMDAVKSAEQMAEEQKQSEQSTASSTSSGGLSGGLTSALMNKIQKKDAPQSRATFMTTTTEVLKMTTTVSDADVAVPAGFKENK